MTNMKHVFDTKLRPISKRFVTVEKPQVVDTEEIRRQIRLSKDAGHSKMPTYHTVLEKLLEAYEVLNGKPEDFRRKYGESHDEV